ncbi:MAG TPA: restriction endonuclease subunit S [Terriglobales bacterium]|nr:restriction endonuclease subunit S [Terriglobales bacterium]
MELALREICDFINGGPWSEDEYVDAGIRVVKVSNMEDGRIVPRNDDNFLPLSKYEKYKKHELKTDDVVVATVGSHPTQPGSVVGRTSRIPPEYSGSFLNQNAVCLRSKNPELCNQRYLFYLSQTVLFRHHIESRARGSANQVRMAVSELKKFTAVYPCVKLQKKIAAVLSAYDELIENNRRRITLLEALAENVYREWFVRFRFPGHDKVTFAKGAPARWEQRRLGSVLELCYGKALKEADRVPGDFHVYGSSGVVGSHNEALVKGPGLIVGRKGNVGSVFFADRGFFPIDTVYFVKSDFPNTFLYFLLRSMNFINNDAAVPGLNRGQAYSNELSLPPNALILEFARIADAHFEMKQILVRQNENLISVRDQILPRLISGKLSLKNIDIHFPASMAEESGADSRLTAHA